MSMVESLLFKGAGVGAGEKSTRSWSKMGRLRNTGGNIWKFHKIILIYIPDLLGTSIHVFVWDTYVTAWIWVQNILSDNMFYNRESGAEIWSEPEMSKMDGSGNPDSSQMKRWAPPLKTWWSSFDRSASGFQPHIQNQPDSSSFPHKIAFITVAIPYQETL